MSRSASRLPDRKPRATAARLADPRRQDSAELSKVELELRDGRYLLAYKRTASGHDA